MIELLSPGEMAKADQMTIDAGVPGIDLMEAAGAFLHQTTMTRCKNAKKVLVVCGPGNNGGDGYVLARLLGESRTPVDVFNPLGTGPIAGDAKIAFERMGSAAPVVASPDWSSYDLIVDALFGAGLSKPVKGDLAQVVAQINASPAQVLAVDLPSGINGESGAVCGVGVEADVTATFFRKKPGHILLPGRLHCGETHVGQIGIKKDVLPKIGVRTFRLATPIWESALPEHNISQHKYSRGHTVVLSGPVTKSGAARLMATAALRIGSGLVTLASSSDCLPVHAGRLDSVMFAEVNNADDFARFLNDTRLNSICLGPGMTPDERTCQHVQAALEAGRNTVLDAGAISAFENRQAILLKKIPKKGRDVVMTPHEGEFRRLFPDLAELPSKTERARQAAAASGAVVVLKGPDTVVADKNGAAAIADNAPPWLATAGSGDVLAGMIAGLLAQGMPAFEAACAAVWIHGEAANRIGQGLVSSELDQGIAEVIRAHLLFSKS